MNVRRVAKEVSVEMFMWSDVVLRQSKMYRPQSRGIREEGELIRKQRTGTKSSRLEKYLQFLDGYMNLQPAGSLSVNSRRKIRLTKRCHDLGDQGGEEISRYAGKEFI